MVYTAPHGTLSPHTKTDNHMPDDNTSDGHSEGGNPTNPEETVSVGHDETLNLSELNALLGRNYASKDVALKSIKETYSYTGKVGQLQKQVDALSTGTQQPQIGSELESTVKALQSQLDEQTFLAERPEFKEYLPTLRELRKNSDKSLSELTSSEAFKPLFEKSLAQDAAQKKRSVLESNPRLGQVRDKMQESKNLLREGDVLKARETAVSNVLDAYDLHS